MQQDQKILAMHVGHMQARAQSIVIQYLLKALEREAIYCSLAYEARRQAIIAVV